LAKPGNKERQRLRQRDYRRALRVAAEDYLGGVCAHCGFDDRRALQIDHVNDDGWDERKRDGPTWYQKMVKRILAGEGDGRYQLLCANCNWIKRFEREGR
jgi:RNase P subunit RPR2